jgi:hypothetical protein
MAEEIQKPFCTIESRAGAIAVEHVQLLSRIRFFAQFQSTDSLAGAAVSISNWNKSANRPYFTLLMMERILELSKKFGSGNESEWVCVDPVQDPNLTTLITVSVFVCVC